ncbi:MULTISPECIES: hypothetical protein [unclassified Vibrio]|jgi:hypothetical protein|uniref:hypothetical protein n=1 Tax=unclassified Vibrio TaxID=2614977 RepID=UPI001A8C3505|nr:MULTISPECIES: hypothetical protein [unclassified Vibrio]MBO0139374.1 hypothetical protein [Vibrio sp. Vb2736]BDR21456.1 hypothetical protein VspSTUT16_48030 [Vibrio sp. STUT-A16]
MKLNEIQDEHLEMEIANFVEEMQGWLNGEEINEDILMFMKMRLELLMHQVDSEKS